MEIRIEAPSYDNEKKLLWKQYSNAKQVESLAQLILKAEALPMLSWEDLVFRYQDNWHTQSPNGECVYDVGEYSSAHENTERQVEEILKHLQEEELKLRMLKDYFVKEIETLEKEVKKADVEQPYSVVKIIPIMVLALNTSPKFIARAVTECKISEKQNLKQKLEATLKTLKNLKKKLENAENEEALKEIILNIISYKYVQNESRKKIIQVNGISDLYKIMRNVVCAAEKIYSTIEKACRIRNPYHPYKRSIDPKNLTQFIKNVVATVLNDYPQLSLKEKIKMAQNFVLNSEKKWVKTVTNRIKEDPLAAIVDKLPTIENGFVNTYWKTRFQDLVNAMLIKTKKNSKPSEQEEHYAIDYVPRWRIASKEDLHRKYYQWLKTLRLYQKKISPLKNQKLLARKMAYWFHDEDPADVVIQYADRSERSAFSEEIDFYRKWGWFPYSGIRYC